MAKSSSPNYPPYSFNTPSWSEALGWNKPQYYTTIHCADVTGNGQADILARSASGIVGGYLCKGLGNRLIRLPSGPSLSDQAGYDDPLYYETIQYADVDGDGRAELIVRRSGGIQVFKLNDPASNQETSTDSPILPSFMTWSALADNQPAWSDENKWNQAQYYTTIQAADIDGDGKAELLSRTPEGHVVAYKYFPVKDDPTKGSWQLLQAEGPYWASNEGWDNAEYYTTMQTADIDGDHRAELLVRGSEGLIAYKYVPTPNDPLVGTWIHLQTTGAPSWPSSEGWDQPSHYTTIQTADIDGDGKAEVIARGPGGIEVYRYTPSPTDPTAGSWEQLATLQHWTNESGGDQRADYATIQCADVDGDGRAEILGRSNDGIEVWKYDPSGDANPWTALPSLTHWGNASIGYDENTQKGGEQYYLTIQCADIDGDGQAEVLGRYDGGIEAFKYESSTQGWLRVAPHFAKVPFPQYSGHESKAYTYISRKLLPNAVNPNIRDQYNMESASPKTWTSILKDMRQDPHISEDAWRTVKTQLLLEFSDVTAVQPYFKQTSTLITKLALSRSLIVPGVSSSVGITSTQKSSHGISATLATMILGIVNAVAIVASDGAGLAAGVFASVMGAVLNADPSDDSAVIREASELDTWIETQFTNSNDAHAHYETDVLCDWGLLHTLGTLVGGGGPWEKSNEYVDTAVNAAQGSFKLWVYQKLMPIKYPSITLDPSVSLNEVDQQKTQEPLRVDWVQKIGDDSYNFYYIGNYDDGWIFPTAKTMNEIWSLGATKEDFFLRKNGWDQFKSQRL